MLALPHAALQVVRDNWMAGTPTATPGTPLSQPGATPHTKSSTTSLLSALSLDGYLIHVALTSTNAPGVDSAALCDIMYDPAGGTAWQVLIPNLICGFRAAAATTFVAMPPYVFPLFIPKGSAIGARWQSILVSPAALCRAQLTVYTGLSRPAWWYGHKVTAVGADTATSAGLDLNPGSTGTYSSWANIGGTSNRRFKYLTIGVQGTASTHTADVYHVQYGHGSTQLPGAQIRFGYTTAELLGMFPHHLGIYCDIADATQLQCRATGSDATSEDPSVVLYGVS